MTATVTVIICAYTLERKDELSAAFDSVVTQEPSPDEVLVVIDHNEELLSWMQEKAASTPANGSAVRVVPSTGPKGLSGARNTGVALAGSEVVAFLDDDAEAEPGWLAGLVRPYQDPMVVAVGGWVDPLWETRRPAWFPEEFGWVVGCSYRGLPTHLAPVRNPIGANMSFRRGPLSDAGAFSEGIGRNGNDAKGCEETEASIRVSQAVPGSRILLAHDAKVRHRVPEPRTSWAYFRRRCYAEGQSKALVSQMVGSGKGLASERTYVSRTLPSGIGKAVARSWQDRDLANLRQAAAIVGGLLATATGYAVASARSPFTSRDPQ